ncbi:MAG: ubiquinol-cytochrome C chaperone family protein [Pseudomonadota bacterium]
MFDAATTIAREPHWYVEGKVADTLDGRFAMLATIVALILVRLERAGEGGNAVSVALTERFIAVMEAEHRELGLGDPTLGKTVRKLVGALGRRTELWRRATAAGDWARAARDSLNIAHAAALDHDSAALKQLWSRLGQSSVAELEQGSIR